MTGEISLPGLRETFFPSIGEWSVNDYKNHWYRQVVKALEGNDVCFVIDWGRSVEDVNRNERVAWGQVWVLYWLSAEVAAFQNSMLISSVKPVNPDEIDPGRREIEDEDGGRISEWCVLRHEIEVWRDGML